MPERPINRAHGGTEQGTPRKAIVTGIASREGAARLAPVWSRRARRDEGLVPDLTAHAGRFGAASVTAPAGLEAVGPSASPAHLSGLATPFPAMSFSSLQFTTPRLKSIKLAPPSPCQGAPGWAFSTMVPPVEAEDGQAFNLTRRNPTPGSTRSPGSTAYQKAVTPEPSRDNNEDKHCFHPEPR